MLDCHRLTPLPYAAQSKAFSAKKKGVALNNLQNCLRGQVDQAIYLKTDKGSVCRFDSHHGRLFFIHL